MSRVIVIGECRLEVEYSADLSRSAARPGGVMTGLALRSASEGNDTLFLTEVAADTVGDSLIAYLSERGVDMSHADRFTDGLTPLLARRQGAAPTLYTRYPAADGLDVIWPKLSADDDIVFFGDYMTLSPRWARNYSNLMSYVATIGCPAVYLPGDISWREPRATKIMPGVFDNLERATAVMLDEPTCQYYFGTSDPEKALKDTVDYYCHTILFRSSDGSLRPVGAPLPESLKLP